MGKINSKKKGASGEREFANYLCSKGYEARRGIQYQGGPDSPDVVCESLSAMHFEVKRTERLKLYAAVEQAIGDSGDVKIPVVAHRKSRKEWVVVLRADDFFKIIDDLYCHS